MATSPSDQIALLIDADNAPASKIEFIIAELASHGMVNIRRAYGNWKKKSLAGWEQVLHEYAIQPQQFFDLVKGKNATDMGLLIDAMDILYTKEVDTFCLVSSDCDFTPLALRLRAEGKKVIGFGDQKTPAAFTAACSHFLYLDGEAPSDAAAAARSKTPLTLELNPKLISTLRSAVKAAADEDGWAPLAPVGSLISNQGSFDHRTYGYKKLSDLFDAIDLFELRKSGNGSQTQFHVRLK